MVDNLGHVTCLVIMIELNFQKSSNLQLFFFIHSSILVALYSKSIDGDTGLYVLITCGTFADVSSDRFIRVESGGFRLFLAIYLFNVYLITNVYKSSFVSVLTYPIDPAPISRLTLT